MKKSSFLAILIIFIILIPGVRVLSWWDVGHRTLAARAIDFLPEKWRTFFKFYQYFIEETSVWPDTVLRRNAGEGYNHYYDMEYPMKVHLKNPEKGRLPWRVEELMNNLTNYIKNKDWYNVLLTAGLLSHYLADSTQPYHSTADYNPPVTSNISAPGVRPKHGVVEGTQAKYIDQIIPADLNITPIYIDNPFKFMFKILNESYSFLPELNSIVLGKNITDPSDDRDWPELKPLLENRSIRAIWLISSMWYTAIVDADAIDKAPDPTQFAKLSIAVKGDTLSEKGANMFLTIYVKDAIKVPVKPDSISLRFGDDSITLKNIDLGAYSANIPFELIKKYGGESVKLEIIAVKKGYSKGVFSEELSVPIYKEEAPPPIQSYMLYIILVIAILIGIAVSIYIAMRRR